MEGPRRSSGRFFLGLIPAPILTGALRVALRVACEPTRDANGDWQGIAQSIHRASTDLP